jgi:hypothetical protein
MKTTVNVRQDLAKLIDELGFKKGAEIGVFHGEFSEFLLANTKIEKLWSIDAWDPNIKGSAFKKWAVRGGKLEQAYEDAVRRLDVFDGRSTIIRKPSLDAVEMFKDEELDFVYIDASHMFSGVALDLISWWPKVRMGGLFSGHDYWTCYRCEVMDAVNGFLVEHQQVLHLTTGELTENGRTFYPPTWWTIKNQITKDQYNGEVAAALPQLVADRKRLKDKGVTVILPYQYFGGQGDECQDQ